MIQRIVLDIIVCPRCGLDHKALVKAYTNSIIIGDVEITHWAFCENFDEPILVTEIDDGDGTVAFWRFQ
jgi:hypothetical protein